MSRVFCTGGSIVNIVMINKNVYIFYPAGYYGKLIRWAVLSSDATEKYTVPDNPINKTNSTLYGGEGTNHLMMSIPTHQGIFATLAWMTREKSEKPVIHLINSCSLEQPNIEQMIFIIMYADPSSVIINIHANNDQFTKSFGTINCVTKWPTYMQARGIDKIYNFDSFNCSADLHFRNLAVKNDRDMFYELFPLDYDAINKKIDRYYEWYQVRNSLQPHEINSDHYPTEMDITDRIFEICINDLPSMNFLPWFEDFMRRSKVSDDYSLERITDILPEFIAAQRNLQWYKSMEMWEQTGVLDDYLTSHSIIEAQVMLRIFYKHHIYFYSQAEKEMWAVSYLRKRKPGWPDVFQNGIDPSDYWSLPNDIIQELAGNTGCRVKCGQPPDLEFKALPWETMTLRELNGIHQEWNNR